MRKVLLIAFHFPPFFGSSGIQRTFCFCRDLLKLGWLPHVISAQARAYEKTSNEQVGLIDSAVDVDRVFCLDSARHLSIKGKYLKVFSRPDRWISWIFHAIPKGIGVIRKKEIDVIWSTYPIATAHIIGYVLKLVSKKPWVADFRDPMVEWDSKLECWHPGDSLLRKIRLGIERRCVEHADALVFCTRSAKDICVERYGQQYGDKMFVIPNGYDAAAFVSAEKRVNCTKAKTDKITLLHSGILYPSSDRNPIHFFDAIKELKEERVIESENFQVILRSSGSEELYKQLVNERDCSDIIIFKESIPYVDALAEMMEVNGLLIFQGYTSNPAIPAKIYEYIRAGKPIFGLVAEHGETKRLIEEAQIGVTADIEDKLAIKDQLALFIKSMDDTYAGLASPVSINEFSRFERARELAALFDKVS